MREDYKCSVSKMRLKLRDYQLKTSTYKYSLLHKNHMVTTKQKTQTKAKEIQR